MAASYFIVKDDKTHLSFVYELIGETQVLVKVVPSCWYPMIYDTNYSTDDSKKVSIRSCNGSISSEWIIDSRDIVGASCVPELDTSTFQSFVLGLSQHFVGLMT